MADVRIANGWIFVRNRDKLNCFVCSCSRNLGKLNGELCFVR